MADPFDASNCDVPPTEAVPDGHILQDPSVPDPPSMATDCQPSLLQPPEPFDVSICLDASGTGRARYGPEFKVAVGVEVDESGPCPQLLFDFDFEIPTSNDSASGSDGPCITCPPGEPGPPGDPGADGLSAYELAVEEGFDGTLEEWLIQLEGDPGPPGPAGPPGSALPGAIPGVLAVNGPDGIMDGAAELIAVRITKKTGTGHRAVYEGHVAYQNTLNEWRDVEPVQRLTRITRLRSNELAVDISADGKQYVQVVADPGVENGDSASAPYDSLSDSATAYLIVNAAGSLFDVTIPTPTGTITLRGRDLERLPTSSTTSTTTTTVPRCTGTCVYGYDSASESYSLAEDGCSEDCDCLAPTFCPDDLDTNCFRVRTLCGTVGEDPGQRYCGTSTSSSTTTSTTTTTGDPACEAGCEFKYLDGYGYVQVFNGCGTHCACEPLSGIDPEAENCGVYTTNCVTPVPPDCPRCVGSCQWVWAGPDAPFWTRIANGCTVNACTDCYCDYPSIDGNECGEKVSTPCHAPDEQPDETTTTTSHPTGCGGVCTVQWDSSFAVWGVLTRDNCAPDCFCEAPVYDGESDCEVAQTNCFGTTTTTSTTTSSTTTTPIYCVSFLPGECGDGWSQACHNQADVEALIGDITICGSYVDAANCNAYCFNTSTTTSTTTTTAWHCYGCGPTPVVRSCVLTGGEIFGIGCSDDGSGVSVTQSLIGPFDTVEDCEFECSSTTSTTTTTTVFGCALGCYEWVPGAGPYPDPVYPTVEDCEAACVLQWYCGLEFDQWFCHQTYVAPGTHLSFEECMETPPCGTPDSDSGPPDPPDPSSTTTSSTTTTPAEGDWNCFLCDNFSFSGDPAYSSCAAMTLEEAQAMWGPPAVVCVDGVTVQSGPHASEEACAAACSTTSSSTTTSVGEWYCYTCTDPGCEASVCVEAPGTPSCGCEGNYMALSGPWGSHEDCIDLGGCGS